MHEHQWYTGAVRVCACMRVMRSSFLTLWHVVTVEAAALSKSYTPTDRVLRYTPYLIGRIPEMAGKFIKFLR